MASLNDISLGALSGTTSDDKIESMTRQLNDWGRQISNEEITSVQKAPDGSVRIVQGTVSVGQTVVIGTLYYDSTNTPRIFIGLAPDDQRPGIWISKSGQNVITLLGG